MLRKHGLSSSETCKLRLTKHQTLFDNATIAATLVNRMTAADTEQPRDRLATLVETMMQLVSRGTNGEPSYPSGLSVSYIIKTSP